MSLEPHQEFNQTDHDLLVRLHERFGNFEKNILHMMESLNSRVGQIMADVDTKTDFRDFVDHRDKTKSRIDGLHKRIEKIELERLVDNTKRGVYVDLASWTWRHWAQVITGVGILAAVVKTIVNI